MALRLTLATIAALLLSGSSTAGPGYDSDYDRVENYFDNCPYTFNPAQIDTNADGLGNRCDVDFNNDGFVGIDDFGPLRARFGSALGDALYDPDVDCDSDGEIGIVDFSCLRKYYGLSIPPNGRGCNGAFRPEEQEPPVYWGSQCPAPDFPL